ncbi:MAG: capsid assembly scaffolding protein Gp46 family protein [Pyramidobacter sp.]|jgi:hypothetical protein
MAEGTNNQNPNTSTTQTAAGAGEKTFTQADVDRVVADRLERERKKYAEFDNYKKAKEELDALKAGQMSELEKAQAALAKAQKEAKENADKIKALELTALKSRLAAEGGLPAELADRVAVLWREHHADAAMVDVGGVGAGVADRLRQLGFSPIDVQFGSSSALPNCLNKRAEMWWRLRDWLKAGGALPPDDDLRDDLMAPEYQFTAKGLVQLEKKADMKKRGLPSPDLADALALTFAAPVCTAEDRARRASTAESDFDIFGGD